jgi:hypothetical protein
MMVPCLPGHSSVTLHARPSVPMQRCPFAASIGIHRARHRFSERGHFNAARAAVGRSIIGSHPQTNTTPLPQKLPIAPIFIADSISLAVSREKDGKLRIVYAGWDNANVVQPDGYRQARGEWRGGSTPSLGGALTPPEKLGPPS